MPLNYSKWDALEVSDDSDIEGHPNVDHKSLVRWKQRDIHERRELRNIKIAHLHADIDCNTILRARLIDIEKDVRSKGPPYFSQLVDRLRNAPSEERPPQSGPNDPTYDAMILELLTQVWTKCKEEGASKDDDDLGEKLAKSVGEHVEGLRVEIEKKGKELEEEEKEKEKKITSEDIHEGWDSKYTPPKPEPAPLVKPKEKTKKKEIKTEYETINAPPISSAPTTTTDQPEPSTDTTSDSDEETPELTPTLRLFSQIEIITSDPSSVFQKSFEFIQAHPEIYVEGAVDALLIEAFSAQMRATKAQEEAKGKSKARKEAKYAVQCVHQGLLIQYCEKLGRDGVRMFFRKMITGDKTAIGVFQDDVQKTYKHIIERAKFHVENTEQDSSGGGREQIQLVAANESEGGTITFNLPDGPPPADLRLSSETQGMDIEEIRNALQLRWDLFTSFPDALQEALRSERLEEVNKVLGGMEVPEAEEVVEKLQMGGMLMFSEPGVRDVTKEDEKFPDRF